MIVGEVVLVVSVLVFLICVLGSLGYVDYKRMKSETDARIKTMNSMCSSLDTIKRMLNDKQLRDRLSYVQELRLYYTCCHCQFYEQCKSDAEQESTPFDYLVCEEFREV